MAPLRMQYSMTVIYIFKVTNMDLTVSRYMTGSHKIPTILHSDVRWTIHDYFVLEMSLHIESFTESLPGGVEFGENTYNQFYRNLID